MSTINWDSIEDYRRLTEAEIVWENLKDPTHIDVDKGLLYYSKTFNSWVVRPKPCRGGSWKCDE